MAETADLSTKSKAPSSRARMVSSASARAAPLTTTTAGGSASWLKASSTPSPSRTGISTSRTITSGASSRLSSSASFPSLASPTIAIPSSLESMRLSARLAKRESSTNSVEMLVEKPFTLPPRG